MAQIVYAVAGSGERGQLDNGHTGEHIVTTGQTVFDFEDKPGMSFSFPGQASDPSSISSCKKSE